MKLFVFNPEHDLCIANGNPHYMPPQSALQFAEDCYDVMQFFGEDGDICVPASKVGEVVRNNPGISSIVPWGWNHALLYQLRKQSVPEHLLLDESLINWHTYASERRHTSLFGSTARMFIEDHCSATPKILMSMEACEQFLSAHPDAVFKNPLSGSGRGVRPVKDYLSEKEICWVEKILAQHHYLMGEPRYKVVQDFAALFEIGAKVSFVGYSLFDTKGFVYQSNILLSDEMIREVLEQYVSSYVLDYAINNVGFLLEKKFSPMLRSKVGVDMFIYEREDGSYGLNPMVEINCRHTMGFVAHAMLKRNFDYEGRRFVINTPSRDNPHYSYSIE